MHKDMCYIIMQLFQLIQCSSISRIHTVTFQMPSISTNTLCQQRSFNLDKQQQNVVHHHKPLTHHMHVSSKLFINAKHSNMHNSLPKSRNISMYINEQLDIQEMAIQIFIFVCLVDSILIYVFLNYQSLCQCGQLHRLILRTSVDCMGRPGFTMINQQHPKLTGPFSNRPRSDLKSHPK